ncbi:hypothetical protein L1049_005517 [Liquidambar formosana]|uniref:DUF4283 domain-containing protein n=1 Tax=Liquidambar formosana TaxID=63359 RepID=A0AAP0N1F9_LIQFO
MASSSKIIDGFRTTAPVGGIIAPFTLLNSPFLSDGEGSSRPLQLDLVTSLPEVFRSGDGGSSSLSSGSLISSATFSLGVSPLFFSGGSSTCGSTSLSSSSSGAKVYNVGKPGGLSDSGILYPSGCTSRDLGAAALRQHVASHLPFSSPIILAGSAPVVVDVCVDSLLANDGKVWLTKLDLEFFEPTRVNGKIVVKPPLDVAKRGCEIWKDCLVGQFIDKRPSFSFLRTTIDRLWGRKEMPEIITTDGGMFMFRFSDLSALEWVLDNGPWHIGGKPLILRKWKPMMDLSKPMLSKLPIWVKFYKVPPEYWLRDGLSYVASAIGTPLYRNGPTVARSRLSYARVCVEIDANSDFPTSFDLELEDGSSCEILAEYPWKPLVYKNCSSFGHSTLHCPLSVKKDWVPKKVEISNTIPGNPSIATDGLVVDSIVDRIVVEEIIPNLQAAPVAPVNTAIMVNPDVLPDSLLGVDQNAFQLLSDGVDNIDSLSEDGVGDGESTPIPLEIPDTDSSPEYNFKISNLKVDELVKTPKGHKKKKVNNKNSKGAKGS